MDFDKPGLAETYDRWYASPLGDWVDRCEKEAVFALLPPVTGLRILDAGCGTGNFSLVLAALAKALPGRIPAQSCGTMTNVSLGGLEPSTGRPFTYYETVGGGMGASPAAPGLSGVHTHMTNSLNTPVEALELAYPLRVVRYSLRRGSGGRGRHRGGDGIVREVRLLVPGRAAILAERHRIPPRGSCGGAPGRPGRAWRIGRGRRRIGSKTALSLRSGESLRVETPGGGGWGRRRPRRPPGAGPTGASASNGRS